jgi:hypothetical protein
MKKNILIGAVIASAVAAGVAAYFVRRNKMKAAGQSGEEITDEEDHAGKKAYRHLSNAFSKAKTYANGQPAV